MATTIPAGIDLGPILALSEPEKRAVVSAILETLPEEEFDTADDPWMTDELKAELLRRAADAVAHPEAGIPWEVVKAELLGRVPT